jgi:hypothetical protein
LVQGTGRVRVPYGIRGVAFLVRRDFAEARGVEADGQVPKRCLVNGINACAGLYSGTRNVLWAPDGGALAAGGATAR